MSQFKPGVTAKRSAKFLDVVRRKYKISECGSRLWSNRTDRIVEGWVSGSRQGQCQHRKHKVWAEGKDHTVREHHIIWFLVHGEWPDNEIDHIDQDGINNHPSNLRLVDHQVNSRNLPLNKKNTSGINGVFWNRSFNRWIAQATSNIGGVKKNIYLGCHSSLLDAVSARKSYDLKNGFSANHGLIRRPEQQKSREVVA